MGCDRGRRPCSSGPRSAPTARRRPGSEVGPLRQIGLPMTTAPADLSRWTMNASAGVLPASAQEPAVVAMPVVLMLSLTMIGMPSSGRLIAAADAVRRPRVREGRRADGDDGVEDRVELADPVQVELRQLNGSQPVRIHQLLELRDRRRVDVDARDAGVRRFGREPVGAATAPATPSTRASRVVAIAKESRLLTRNLHGFGWGGRWDRTTSAAIRGADPIPIPLSSLRLFRRLT